MRRSITALALFSSLALVACEDGPAQTFQPQPPGSQATGGAQGTAQVDPASKQGFNATVGGVSRTDICPADVKAARWKKMVKEPIMPPSIGGGLDISGGPTWSGMTIDQAEDPGVSDAKPHGGNCQSTNAGDQFGNGTIVNTWGDNSELWMDYRVSTRKANWLNFWAGYQGTVDFTSPDGADKFQIPVQTQIQKNGAPLVIDWLAKDHKAFGAPFNQLYRGLIHTFAPAIPLEPDGTTCYDTGRCVQGSFGDVAYFYVPAIGFAIWIDNQNAAQPTPSIPTRLDQDLAKNMAFSFANPFMKLDAEGPVAKAGELLPGAGSCDLKMGLTFDDFLKKCVKTTGDAKKDATELNKLLGGLSHGTERFGFDLTGVDVNFTDNALPKDEIVKDTDVPGPADTATQFNVDQSTLGTIRNDYNETTGKKDLHGAGAVYREYARLVRKELLSLTGIKDGDTSKCVFPVGYAADPSFDPASFWKTAPAYCTGFEGFITTSAPSGAPGDFTNLGVAATGIAPGGLKTGLKPGHQKVVICDDANGDSAKGYQSCIGGDNFSTSFKRVLQVFGHGRLSSLPSEVQDVRFFWRQYFKALVKYFKVANDVAHTDLSDVKVDPDNLFFDSIGAGQFEIGEYVERQDASKTQEPIDMSISADVKNGIFARYTFSRDLFRGENALYAAVLEDQSHGLGQENHGLLTNLFGSPVLKAAFSPSKDGKKTAYYCATHADPAACDGQTCPLDPTDSTGTTCLTDEVGRATLDGYPGAFTQTAFSLGDTTVQVKKTFSNIQQATVVIPLTTDPYDTTSTSLPNYETLVPWAPNQPGVGFPVPLNGGIDKFVQTSQIDFSGTTITANIDYDVRIDPATHKADKDGKLTFKAVETTDFLGQVFLCQDAASGDILSARMYTPVANILNWLASHPGTYASCQMVIRYSPFGNYADYITSLTNGVRLNITQGGGYGRVVDVTLFVPGQ